MNDRFGPDHPPAPVVPNNIEAEQNLLGAILVHPPVFETIASIIQPQHFFEELHRRIFTIVKDMVAAGKLPTPTTINPYMGDVDLGGVTTKQYLARLAASATTVMNAPSYARAIVDMAIRRDLIDVFTDGIERARDAPAADTPTAQIAGVEQQLQMMRANTASLDNTTLSMIGDAAARVIERAKRVRSGEENDQSLLTGIDSIDRVTGGMRGGELWIVGARPGVGKTAWVTSILRQAVKTQDDAAAMLFQLEVPEQQITARFLSDLAYDPKLKQISFGDIMRAKGLDDGQMYRLEHARRDLAELPIALDCASSLTIQEIRARVNLQKQLFARQGRKLRAVGVDYLKFVKASQRYTGQRVYEVGEISAGLKQMAKDFDVCMILLAQLNRQVETREDKRPQLSDLRESGDLEADADVVGFLYREAYYLSKTPEARRGDALMIAEIEARRHDMELIFGKNRAGSTDTALLWCDMPSSRVAGHRPGEMRAGFDV